MFPLLWVAAFALILVAAAPQVWARGWRHHHDDGNGQQFEEAELFIEYNSTAGDIGIQVFLDDDNWRRINISDPKDKTLFKVSGEGSSASLY